MDLKILQKKSEPLLSRTRVESEIVFDKATPSGQEVKSALAKSLGKDEKLVDVKSIYTIFGLKKAKVLSYAYDNEETMKIIKIRKKKTEKKPKEETEAKPEEAKKEAKEGKKEEKKEAKENKKEPEKK